jgi:phosphate transporter
MDIVTNLVSRDKLIEWEMFATEVQNKNEDGIFPSVRLHGFLIALTVSGISLLFPVITPNDPAAGRCMSLLLFIICLWVTEAVPYFATAILIPVLVIFMGVLKDPATNRIMSSEAAAQFVTSHIFNHTTWLLLGGYTISTAFSRCQLELRLASVMQVNFGHHPKLFILAVMCLGLFLSMWINNHTAPILCGSIILPIVKDLPTDSRYVAEVLYIFHIFNILFIRFSKSLLLGLAFACNFGGMLLSADLLYCAYLIRILGMMTPISSLQNALATSHLEQVILFFYFCCCCILSKYIE